VPKKAKATNGAIVYLVLDKSGSMGAIAEATRDGVNHFIRETALADPNAQYHELQFSTVMHRVHSGIPVSNVEPHTYKTYRPGGGTALLDAVGNAIKDIDDLKAKPSKVVVVIMTDGQENSSHEYTRAAVQALIKEREQQEDWQFLFLGANVDAFDEAGAIGLAAPAASSATWQPTGIGTRAAYMALSTSTSDYLAGFSSSATLTQNSYNQTLASLSKDPSAMKTGLDTVDKAAKKVETP
jgi:uncharacterized protein YegL